MATDNLAIIREFLDKSWNASNPSGVDAFLAEGYVDHVYEPANAEGLRKQIGALARAFPDHVSVIEDALVDGDRVMLRMNLSGTHAGAFRDMAPTGKKIDVRVARWFRLDTEGKIAEHWALLDTATLVRQISAN
ncbi:ester cyclase [Accumulibacter sp.]|uniref:ester cyclase n=1 Tax=Accumulibacter sp. TaxID=2053492 RepID=UPI00261A2CB9|nr:ester cyclase [Accumulibacter sp.]